MIALHDGAPRRRRVSTENLLAKLNRRVGVGIQKVRLYRIRRSDEPESGKDIPGVEIFLLTREQLPLLRGLIPSLDLAAYEGRMGGNVCYCASRSGQLAHCTWVQTSGSHRIKRAGRVEEIKPGEFWIYECLTSRSQRGLGIYPAVLSRVVRDQFDRGLQEGVIYTTPQNVPSQRGILKAGFRFAQTLRSIRIGRIYVPISSPRTPDAG
jgi:hypothetical protein